jgi:transcriptional regulator with XRE-family HTH domain
MMKIEELKKRKKEMGYSNAKLAELTGVPLGTIQKVFSGATAAPRRATLLALERILCPEGSMHSTITQSYTTDNIPPSMVCEPQAAYSSDRQGAYTLDDYYALPDERRVELIDGVFYDMTAPATFHQLIGGLIHSRFVTYVTENKGTCVPFIAPVDVQLDRDDKTMLEPDIIVVCDRDKIIRRCIYGAPDFAAEVLSPSTKSRDLIIKLNEGSHITFDFIRQFTSFQHQFRSPPDNVIPMLFQISGIHMLPTLSAFIQIQPCFCPKWNQPAMTQD